MAIKYHPQVGQILLCDFSVGFKEPEMVKINRPVIVVSPSMKERPGLVTILALSTVKPSSIMDYHYKIPKKSMPQLGRFQKNDTWLKGDMIYTVGFHRLDLIKLNKRHPTTGKRVYFKNKLGRDQMKIVYSCLLSGFNLRHLNQHI